MIYPVVINGTIKGSTRWPNKFSSTGIDATSQEWLDYVAARDRVLTSAERMQISVERDPAIKAIAQELESRFPGFIAAAKARL